MKHKIKSFMYFIGLSKKDYEIIKPNIATYNRVMLGLFLYLASILMCGLLILSYILPTIFPNNIIYLGTLIFSLLILIISNKIDKTSYKATQILIYITISLFLIYSILTDTIFHPNQVSVTFIVMLVFLPILFIDRPIRCLGFSIGFTILFIILDYMVKPDNIVSIDILNVILYCLLGIVSGYITDNIKVNNFLLENKLQKLGITDILTQTRNRNAFELDIKHIADQCQKSLTFIYIDVNGLHEINNELGHQAGDDMLKYVANQLNDIFYMEPIYRIGGDEFVVFVAEVAILQKLHQLNKHILSAHYHIAIGYSFMDEDIDINQMIKIAEKKMYKDKKHYYTKYKLQERTTHRT